MAVFSANRAAFTPSLTAENWNLVINTGVIAGILGIGWGGRATTSTAYRTRWLRPSAQPSVNAGQLTVQKHSPGSAATNGTVYTTFFSNTTFAAEPENMYATDWNAHGGHGELFLPVNFPWLVGHGGASQKERYFCCINTVGTDANASNYWVMWEE